MDLSGEKWLLLFLYFASLLVSLVDVEFLLHFVVCLYLPL